MFYHLLQVFVDVTSKSREQRLITKEDVGVDTYTRTYAHTHTYRLPGQKQFQETR